MSEYGPKKPNKLEAKEAGGESRLIGRITMLRHGQTHYTGEFPDLTELGQETIHKSAEQIALGLKPEEEEVEIYSSNQPRARGSAEIIKKNIAHPKEVSAKKSIGMMEIRNLKKAKEIFQIITGEGDKMETEEGLANSIDYAYTHDPRFEDAKIFEPRSEVEKRFFRNLEYAIRAFGIVANKTEEEKKELKLKRPHLIATSHFEVLNHFVQKTFGLNYPKDSTLKHGELIEIFLYDHPDSQDELIDLTVRFRGQERLIKFDRRRRALILE